MTAKRDVHVKILYIGDSDTISSKENDVNP